MMLVMWVVHQAIFDIGHTFGVGRLGSGIWWGKKIRKEAIYGETLLSGL